MTKKLLIGAFVVLAVVLLAAGALLQRNPAKTDDGESSAAITDNVVIPSGMPERIIMSTPPGFTETQSEYYEKYYILNDASIIISGEPIVSGSGQSDLGNYVADVKRQYEYTVDEYQLLNEDTITVSGVPCYLLEFSYALIGADVRQDFRCMTAILLKDDYAYLVTCKSHNDTFDLYRSTFRQAIAGISVADSAAGTDAAYPAETSSQPQPAETAG